MRILTLSLFFITNILSGQTSEEYFKLAKDAYPNYKKTIYYLNKAIFAENLNSSYYLTRAKVKILTGDPVAISEAAKDLNRAWNLDMENPYVYCWQNYLDACKRGSSPMLVKGFSVDDPEVLNFVVRSNIYMYKFKPNTYADNLFQNFDKGVYSFKSLITCLEKSFIYEKWKSYRKKIVDKLLKLSEKDLFKDSNNDVAFNLKSLPNFRAPNSNLLSFRYTDFQDNVFNEEEFIRQASTNIKLIKRILLFESNREKMSQLCYKANNKAYPKFVKYEHLLSTLYKIGEYKTIIGLSSEIKAGSKSNYYLGLSLYESGQYSSATKVLAKYIKFLKTADLSPAFYLIRSLIKERRFKDALKFIHTVKSEVQKKLFLCEYYFSIHDFERYLKVSQELAKSFPNTQNKQLLMQILNTNQYHFIAQNNFISTFGSKERKASNYKQLARTSNLDYLLLSQLNLYLKKGKKESFLEVLNYSKSLEPDNIKFRIIEAKSLAVNGKSLDSLKMLEKIISSSPYSKEAIILKGMLQMEKLDLKASYKTFSSLADKASAEYLKLVPLFIMGKYDLIEQSCKKIFKTTKDYRVLILLHMLWERKDKNAANQFLKVNLESLQMYPAKFYAGYKLGKISLEEYKKKQDFGPLFGPKFNFTIGFEAMQKGEKEKALKHFKKCLIPFSIDLPEYHMAKACIKILEK